MPRIRRTTTMALYALGLNHLTAPLALRSQVAFQIDTLGHALRELIGRPKVKEAAILSTCNRTEVYFNGAGAEPVVQWLEEFHQVPKSSLSPYVYTLPQEKAVQHASRFHANAITLNELPERLAQFDIIVTSTASSLPILGKGLLERAIKARRHAPMFIVDLAVPRDVEPEASELDDVFLYGVDDLANIIKDNLQIRVEAVAQAESMIAAQTESFLRWLEGRSVVPTITALHGHHDQLRAAEVERAKRLLANGAPTEQVLEQLARGLTNKFLHAPTQALNQAGEAERAELLALFQRIYQLPDEH